MILLIVLGILIFIGLMVLGVKISLKSIIDNEDNDEYTEEDEKNDIER